MRRWLHSTLATSLVKWRGVARVSHRLRLVGRRVVARMLLICVASALDQWRHAAVQRKQLKVAARRVVLRMTHQVSGLGVRGQGLAFELLRIMHRVLTCKQPPNPSPYTLNPTPKPYTLNPNPGTLNPKPGLAPQPPLQGLGSKVLGFLKP